MGHVKLELREIWRSGTPLSEAWLIHAPHEERKAYRALEGAPVENAPDPGPCARWEAALLGIAASVAIGSSRLRDLANARSALQELARAQMESGTLVTIGFPDHAEGISRPATIDPDIIVMADIHWSENRISGNDNEFLRVIVVPQGEFIEARGAKSPRGRPGKYREIDLAIERAISDNSRILGYSNKEIHPRLIEHLMEIDPAGFRLGKGYSPSALNARLAAARKRFS